MSSFATSKLLSGITTKLVLWCRNICFRTLDSRTRRIDPGYSSPTSLGRILCYMKNMPQKAMPLSVMPCSPFLANDSIMQNRETCSVALRFCTCYNRHGEFPYTDPRWRDAAKLKMCIYILGRNFKGFFLLRKFSALFVGNIFGRLAVMLIVARVFCVCSSGGGGFYEYC